MTGWRKVLDGVIQFRKTVRKDLVTQFKAIRDNPNPTAVMFTCMDSRILPARFTQSQVGDMFIVRNSGNMIPHSNNYGQAGFEVSVTTEPAALELAVKRGKIKHVIVCGHSDCKAINTLYNLHCCPKTFNPESPMDHWLRRHGYSSLQKLEKRLSDPAPITFISDNPLFSFTAVIDPEDRWGVEDKLSQINTLQQLEHIASHGFLKEFLATEAVDLHAMWFDVYEGEMYMFSNKEQQFVIINEESADRLLKELDKPVHGFEYLEKDFIEQFPNILLRPIMNTFTRIIAKRFQGSASQASALTKPRRFYKEVGMKIDTAERGDVYKITLDGRVLKTQGGNQLQIESEPLALAIAEEWASQEEFINMGHMRLTGLTFTAQDNPLHTTKESITSKVLEYLDGDTVLFWNPESDSLYKAQQKHWAPVIEHANKEMGTSLKPQENMFEDAVSKENRVRFQKWLMSHDHWALHGIQYAVESAKSVLLPFNVLSYKMTVPEAIYCTMLEQKVQSKTWGEVEWAHGIEEEDLATRLSAATLFTYFNSNKYTKTTLR